MSVNLSPVAGAAAQFLDNSGNVLTGGKLYTYLAGTTTPAATYTSFLGTTFHANPIILDAAGRVPSGGEIWLSDNIQYKFVLKDANDVLIATWDNLSGINSNFVNYTIQEEVQTATAGQTVFNLSTVTYAPGTNSLSVYVDGVNQYEGSTYSFVETNATTVTFTAGLHVGALVKFTTAVPATGTATNANVVVYDPAGVGAVVTTVQDKLRETVSVKDFGAVGDGVADDTTAIQSAINYVVSLGGGTVQLNTGTYKTTQTIDLGNASVCFSGQSMGGSTLKADHSSGPVIRIRTSYCEIKNLNIDSFSARANGAAGNNFGILEMPADVLNGEINGTQLFHVEVQNQPSHGIAFVTGYKDARITNCAVFYCKGHGIWTDDGSTGSLQTVNFQRVGGLNISTTRIAYCDGHGVAIGQDIAPGFRITLDNCDILWCALTAGVRYSAHAAYIRADNALVINNAFAGFSDGGYPTAGPRVQTLKGVFINGRAPNVHSNRFVDCLTTSIEFGSATRGAVVDDVYVTQTAGNPNQNPAVQLNASATGARINSGVLENIDRLATPSVSGCLVTANGILTTGFRSRNSELTVNDDSVFTFEFTAVTRGVLVLGTNISNARPCMVAFRAGDGNAFVNLLTNASNVTVGVGTPTGTTGPDGNLNIYASNTEFKLYIENRRGFNASYMPTFLSLANGELVL